MPVGWPWQHPCDAPPQQSHSFARKRIGKRTKLSAASRLVAKPTNTPLPSLNRDVTQAPTPGLNKLSLVHLLL